MIVLRKNKNNNPVILFMCSPSLGALDSWLSVLRILKKIPYIRGVDKNLTNYRKRKNSLSSNILVSLINGYKVYRNYMKMGHIESFYRLLILSINCQLTMPIPIPIDFF